MNSRDFCFWMQGYIELTGAKTPSGAVWGLILEHLQLAIQDEDYSHDVYEGVVQMLSGFTSIAGTERPTPDQWDRISDLITASFSKVTSEIDDCEKKEHEEEISDSLKKAIEEIQKIKPISPLQPYQPPFIPDPWREGKRYPDSPGWPLPPTIICGTGDDPKKFCTNITSENKLLDGGDQYNDGTVGISDSMYGAGMNIANIDLGANPLGYTGKV